MDNLRYRLQDDPPPPPEPPPPPPATDPKRKPEQPSDPANSEIYSPESPEECDQPPAKTQ